MIQSMLSSLLLMAASLISAISWVKKLSDLLNSQMAIVSTKMRLHTMLRPEKIFLMLLPDSCTCMSVFVLLCTSIFFLWGWLWCDSLACLLYG